MTRDPRSDAEKARADLARNAELGLAVPESPLEEQPSVTPQTFGETTKRGRVLRGGEGAGAVTAEEQDIGDSTGTMKTSRDIPENRQNVETPPTHRSDRSDGVLSRAKE
ncbi:hypothetical protein AA309_04815 [Microvirga vignae]|uniref:Uncharacterized protein n=1 Tax=Microvirga vignae TaxID=1225564 RepID=A0A0H1RGQ3_9HYPH|nr:hypothetical protein [Microvirga vignae]KLK94279.1 hypothetical protein AA309_04815 [Microvirga vignae]